MTEALQTLQEIRDVNASFPFTDPVKAWKAEGKKVLGYTCIIVPEELIHAAGILPFRVTGSQEESGLNQADAIFYTSTCSFIRSCLELKLRGDYNFLDAYVGSTPCEGAMRLAEVGGRFHTIPLLYIMDVPRKINERSIAYYRNEIFEFKKRLEDSFGAKISDGAIADSIALYNTTRTVFKKLSDLRKRDTPPLSGAEMMEVLNAAVRMPREEFNALCDTLVTEIERTQRALPQQPRLMISGSVLNNSEFIKSIEDLGVTGVADDVCTGSRYWWDPVEESSGADPLMALAKRYLNMTCPCPRTNPPTHRMRWIQEMAREFRIDGVIALTMRNCAPYIHDLPLWKGELVENGTPVLDLDIEYGSALTGQVRIRVEAFLEMITCREEWE
ncbi:MAG: 2-hydroxyacyl-CoA dehydratase family protein [Desulfobacterales bacterium]|nr:2-hydroxyacyl-CoA dehydratase family protein [Desulfobacterales bacterium]